MRAYEQTHLKPYFKPMRTSYELKFPETREERYGKAVALKSNGNNAFKAKSFAEARDLYEQAKALIIHHEWTALELDLLVAVHSNLAQCALNLVAERKVEEREALHRAVCDCTQALELQPMHKKARYHRAKGLIQLGALDAAKMDIGTLEGPERDAMQNLLGRAVGAHNAESLILQLDDLRDLKTKSNRKKWGFLFEDSDPDLRKFGLSSPDAKVGRLFWEACVLLPVDQQVMLIKAIRSISWEEENWENLIPILKEVCKGWNEMRRERLFTALFKKADGKSWGHEIVEWRMRPALLASISISADDARHRRWKELYVREMQLIASAAPTWNKTAPIPLGSSEPVASISEASQATIMIHAMLSAHGKSELVAQVEKMVTESPYLHKGASLLHTMTLAGKDGIVSFLLQRGADPNCLDNGTVLGYKATAIHYALDQLDRVKRDRGWCTPDAAHVAGVKRCIELLKAAGRKETNVPHAAKLKKEGAVDDHDAKPAPEVAPLAAGTSIKVTGLTAHPRAAHYNGQPGVFLGFDRAGRCMVQMKDGNEITIKRENIELVYGSIKGGFLSQVFRSGACGSTGTMRVTVTVPAGKKGGELIYWHTPTGEVLEVLIPMGLLAGQSFQFDPGKELWLDGKQPGTRWQGAFMITCRGDGYIDDHDSDEESGQASSDEDGAWGFSAVELDELAAQGVKPWDEDAHAVLDFLLPGRRASRHRTTWDTTWDHVRCRLFPSSSRDGPSSSHQLDSLRRQLFEFELAAQGVKPMGLKAYAAADMLTGVVCNDSKLKTNGYGFIKPDNGNE